MNLESAIKDCEEEILRLETEVSRERLDIKSCNNRITRHENDMLIEFGLIKKWARRIANGETEKRMSDVMTLPKL